MKKFLSLVLALAMALSLVTVSAGAASFEDDGDITYQEAVTVIAGLGIVDGYQDGSFNPTGGLTRGAAAKIICNLILGPTTAAALNATSAPFSDVPTTNEFSGYIAYCAQNGIISGYADGTFRPSAGLTGYAFMKMLLGALGYDSTQESYTGTNWSIQVAKQALGIGLDDGYEGSFNGVDNVTREEACLYAFNTLQATMVEYETSNTVIVGDVTVTQKANRQEVANNTTSDGNIEDDNLMQFAEEYFEDLTAEPDTDNFGRPATTWDYDGEDLGTYADTADGTLVVSNNYDVETWLTDGNYLNYSDSEVLNSAVVYFNGTNEGTYRNLRDDVIASDGDILEVFENSDGDVDTIVFRSYTYAVVSEVVDNLSSTHTNRGASVGIDLEDIDGNSYGTYYDAYNNSDKVLNGYNAGYTEGTVLAIALSSDNAILDSYEMESLTGTPEAAVEVKTAKYGYGEVVTDGSITIDGTKYPYAGQMTGLEDGENVDFDEEYTIYLTDEGYVLAVDGDATAALDDVYYVAGVFGEKSRGHINYYLDAVSVADGTYYELPLSDAGETDFNVSKDDYDTTVAGLYVLDEDDGEYFIDDAYTGALSDGDKVGSYTAVVASDLSQNVASDSTTIRFQNSGTSRLYLTDTTFFVSVEGEAGEEDLDIATATGVMTVDADDSTNLDVYAFYKTNDSDAVFVVYVADVLAGSVSLSDVVYLTDDASNATSSGYRVDLYALDGMELLEDVVIDSREDQGFYTYDLNSDGIYELTKTNSYDLENQTLTNNEVDDEDGYAQGVTFTDVRSSRATGSTYTDGETGQGSVDFIAVTFADATVIDTRGSSAKNKALYSSDIESASALSTAINRGWVEADVFVEDGEIVFVAVTASEAEGGGSSSGGDTGSGDSVDTSLSGSSAELKSYSISNAGRLTFTMTYTAPDYVAVGSTPDLTIDVSVDGEFWDTLYADDLTIGKVQSDGTVTVTYRSASGEYEVGQELTFEIVDESFTDMKVEYVDGDGKDVTSYLKDGYSKSVAVKDGTITFQLDTNSTEPDSVTYAVEQDGTTLVKAKELDKSSNWGDKEQTADLTGLDVTDDAVVTVVLTGLNGLVQTYTLTNDYSSGETIASSDTLTISVEDDDTGSGSTVSDIEDGDVIYLFATLSGTTDNYGYLVSVEGVTEEAVFLNDTTKTPLGSITVDGDVTIDEDTVTVTAIPNLAAQVDFDQTHVMLTFNRPIDTESLPDFAIDGKDKAELDVTAAEDEDGNTVVTITVVKNATLAEGNKITVSGDFADAEYAENEITGSDITLGTTTELP